MIGKVNVCLTNPESPNPEKVINYYSDSDFEYNICVGDYCEIALDSDPACWISGVIIEINEEDNSFSIKDPDDNNIIKIACDHICDMWSEEECKSC